MIFLKDIPRVGQKFTVKEVSDGYAHNYLLPQKMAEMATPEALLRVKILEESAKVERSVQFELLDKNIQSIHETTITASERANEQGHLFRGLHSADIADIVFKERRLKFPIESFDIKEPIRTTGEHKINLVIKNEKRGYFTLVLIPLQ